MLKRRPICERHKRAAEKNLADRLEILKSKGIPDQLIQKDGKVRQYKAAIRKARLVLTGIDRMEHLMVQKKEAKVQKAAAAVQQAAPKKKKSVPAPMKKQTKKEKQVSEATE